MKNNALFLIVIAIGVVISLPSCGSERRGRTQEKRYEHAKQVYQDISQEYAAEIDLYINNQVAADQVRRCVLTHADQVRGQLGFGSYLSGRSGRYVSYPFLEYTHDLDDAIAQLNKVLRHLVIYDTQKCVTMCQHIQELRQELQEFKIYVISNDRYLVEQDKWDKTQQANAQQAALNSMLVASMNTKTIQQVHVHTYK